MFSSVQSLSHVRLFATPWTVACQAPLSMGILQARILEWVAMPSSRRSFQPRDWIYVSCIAGEFFTLWATWKPKNTGVGSLSLFQGIFVTHKSNQGLLALLTDSLPAELLGKPPGKLPFYLIFHAVLFLKEVIMCSLYLRNGYLYSIFLKAQYLHKLSGTLLHRKFVYSDPFIYLFSHSFLSLWTHGYLFLYFGYNSIWFYLFCCSNCSNFGFW